MTLATRTATDTLQQTLPWGTHERLVFGRALLRSTGFPAEGLALLDSDDILPLLDSFLAAHQRLEGRCSIARHRMAEPHRVEVLRIPVVHERNQCFDSAQGTPTRPLLATLLFQG